MLEIHCKNNCKKKDEDLAELKAQSELALSEKLNKKETEITQLKAKIDNVEVEKKLAVNEAVQKVVKERDNLANN